MEFFTMAFHSLLHFLALFYHRSKTSSWVVILAIFAVAHASTKWSSWWSSSAPEEKGTRRRLGVDPFCT